MINTTVICISYIFFYYYYYYFPLSFVQSHTCSFSLSILHTSPYYVIIFLRHFYHFKQAAVAIEISNLLICFCNLYLSCPKLEKYILMENVYIVLSFLIK